MRTCELRSRELCSLQALMRKAERLSKEETAKDSLCKELKGEVSSRRTGGHSQWSWEGSITTAAYCS